MDKFSQLPEPLLLIIIANLPFKEAARNSILSKLWRRLGRSTQIVEFNERFFVITDAAPADRAIQRLTFIDFVRRWIDNSPKTPVGKVALTFSEPENFQQFVLDCIQFCVKHDVKQLALDFSDPAWDELGYDYHESYFDLPLDVYNHRVLESLALFSCNFDADLVGNFHMLKHISLGWIALPVSVQETLLAQCRLLESLSLKKCWGMNSLDVRGNDLKLKTLVVDRCSIRYPHSFYLEAPKLNYLKFVGGDVPALTTGEGSEFNFFEELDLDLSPVIDFHGSASPNSILDILPRSLVIDFHSFSSPNSILDILPPTRKLTVCSYTLRYYLTPSVLKPQEMWKGNVEVYECITRTLRMVEVKDYLGSQHELDLLRYLLTNGRIMEQLTVVTSSDVEVNGGNPEEFRLKVRQFLHQVEAASQNLEITVL
ncbi:hypothetical protein C1H46_023886 [Malus baccata]|uniref:FBD domain-containing protein n=1 Tax=Malus baccata TaxID=106549 RepID=A0A540LVL1_MALBA|nr:hypothetical protein C1H46_023886 [Malus baccata]